MSLERRRAIALAAREAALTALAENHNVTRAAKAAGRCRQTVHEWLRDPAFRDELERRREARARAFFTRFAPPPTTPEVARFGVSPTAALS